jgi:Protein of unknown function (DUF1566)
MPMNITGRLPDYGSLNNSRISMNKYTKIGADGEKLEDHAKKWVAVLDNKTSLIWAIEETDLLTFADAQAHVADLDIAGFKDWRLPTIEELFMLADRTKFEAAIDTAYFPKCKSDWYWTSTIVAKYPAGYAWIVDFDGGHANWGLQSDDYQVRAVRASQRNSDFWNVR